MRLLTFVLVLLSACRSDISVNADPSKVSVRIDVDESRVVHVNVKSAGVGLVLPVPMPFGYARGCLAEAPAP